MKKVMFANVEDEAEILSLELMRYSNVKAMLTKEKGYLDGAISQLDEVADENCWEEIKATLKGVANFDCEMTAINTVEQLRAYSEKLASKIAMLELTVSNTMGKLNYLHSEMRAV